jgi:hypothetical protein
MRISLLIVLGCISFASRAQSVDVEVPRKKFAYFNTFMAGGLMGESGKGTGLTLSTTHGVRLSRLAFGAGVGFDSYFDWKTLPVFGSISYDFGKVRSNAFFLQVNAGYAEAWLVKDEEDWMPEYRDYGGTMVSSLIGYRITNEKFSMYVMAGHKFQRAHLSYEQLLQSSFAPMYSHFIEEDMNRLVVQIGFGLR